MASLWDEEADVVVLGYGGAGAVAAISAHDAGVKVIVVEKDEGGGNTCLATLTFLCPIKDSAAKEATPRFFFWGGGGGGRGGFVVGGWGQD